MDEIQMSLLLDAARRRELFEDSAHLNTKCAFRVVKDNGSSRLSSTPKSYIVLIPRTQRG
jgi:hypothetical protein